jgi:xylose dehydrogenase (NAD/NADP)
MTSADKIIMTKNRPLRFGILGAANIARSFARGLASSDLVTIAAFASRDIDKGSAFAREVGIQRVHSTYDALLQDPEIDAVYIPLPNALHAEWVIRAAQAGKHILCEKPLAMSATEARAMFDAAREHGLQLAEAYPYRAQPQTLKLREVLASGAIGRIQLIHASFGCTFSDPANIRLDPALGGGALLDAGSYATNFVRMVAGELPLRVHASARWADSGVSRTVAATLEFGSGLLAQVSCSFATAYHRHALISGDSGILETTFLNHPPEGGAPVIHLRRGIRNSSERETIETPGGDGFRAEAEAFALMVAQGPDHWTGSTAQESIDTAAILEAIEQSARTDRWVTLNQS